MGNIMKIRLLAALMLFSIVGFAQHDHETEFSEDDIMLNETLKKMYPHLASDIDAEEAKLEKFTADYIAQEFQNPSRAGVDYIIPVVFHILHEDGPENITNTEVHDAMRILNEDFQMRNDDLGDVVSRFKSITGEAKIEFRLARRDPQGNATNGIDRIRTSLTNQGGENAKLNVWPRNTYLNVWLVKAITSGAAGYTFLPSGANRRPTKDGIILLYNYFSSVRQGNYRRSRALTHEIGHWLNLLHTWGSGNTPAASTNCSDDDRVGDTPLTIGWRSCNANGTSCGSFDNVQNYMEYSYCSNMFTQGQVSRMRAALNSSTAERRDLVSKANNIKAGVLDMELADFSSTKNYACVDEPVLFKDQSLNGAVTWKWEFEEGTPKISNAKNPVVTYSRPGSFKVKLTVKSADNITKTKLVDDYIMINNSVGSFLPLLEGFEGSTESIAVNWVAENEDRDDVYWKVEKGNSFAGENYLMLENIKNTYGQFESIVTAPVDLSNVVKPKLEFYLAHASKSSGTFAGQTKFKVYYSNDCGETWKLKYSSLSTSVNNGKIMDNSYLPQAKTDWLPISITNFTGADMVQNGLIKFEVENRGDNNFFLDNINITGNIADVPILEFPSNNLDSVASSVYLDWKAVPVIDKYEYELSDKSDFSNLVYSGSNVYLGPSPKNSDTRFYAENLTPGTTYFWRVRAVRGSNTSNWSFEWKFTVSSTGKGKVDINGGPFVGLESLDNTGEFLVAIYPNPSNGLVNIQLENANDDNVQVNVYSIQGQKVWSKTETEYKARFIMEEGVLTAGIFVVNVSVNGITKTQKLLVQ